MIAMSEVVKSLPVSRVVALSLLSKRKPCVVECQIVDEG